LARLLQSLRFPALVLRSWKHLESLARAYISHPFQLTCECTDHSVCIVTQNALFLPNKSLHTLQVTFRTVPLLKERVFLLGVLFANRFYCDPQSSFSLFLI